MRKARLIPLAAIFALVAALFVPAGPAQADTPPSFSNGDGISVVSQSVSGREIDLQVTTTAVSGQHEIIVLLPEGYTATIRGEISEMNHAVGSLGGGFILAAVFVYLILVVQFRSFKLPTIIMATVPMGLVGIIAMLALTRTYFSIQAAIGAAGRRQQQECGIGV